MADTPEEDMDEATKERLAKYRAEECPFCHAQSGEPCKVPETGEDFNGYHRARAIAALG
jgi:hypothetical protein